MPKHTTPSDSNLTRTYLLPNCVAWFGEVVKARHNHFPILNLFCQFIDALFLQVAAKYFRKPDWCLAIGDLDCLASKNCIVLEEDLNSETGLQLFRLLRLPFLKIGVIVPVLRESYSHKAQKTWSDSIAVRFQKSDRHTYKAGCFRGFNPLSYLRTSTYNTTTFSKFGRSGSDKFETRIARVFIECERSRLGGHDLWQKVPSSPVTRNRLTRRFVRYGRFPFRQN